MRRALVALACACLLVACGDPTEPTAVTAAGTWTLTKYNNNSLPTAYLEGGTVTSGSLVVNANGSFLFSEAHTVNGASATQTVAGTWTLSGSTVTFDPTDPNETNGTGTVSGNTMTLATDDGSRVYTRS